MKVSFMKNVKTQSRQELRAIFNFIWLKVIFNACKRIKFSEITEF